MSGLEQLPGGRRELICLNEEERTKPKHSLALPGRCKNILALLLESR